MCNCNNRKDNIYQYGGSDQGCGSLWGWGWNSGGSVGPWGAAAYSWAWRPLWRSCCSAWQWWFRGSGTFRQTLRESIGGVSARMRRGERFGEGWGGWRFTLTHYLLQGLAVSDISVPGADSDVAEDTQACWCLRLQSRFTTVICLAGTTCAIIGN